MVTYLDSVGMSFEIDHINFNVLLAETNRKKNLNFTITVQNNYFLN